MNSEYHYFLYCMPDVIGGLSALLSRRGLHMLHRPDFVERALRRRNISAHKAVAGPLTDACSHAGAIPPAVRRWSAELMAALHSLTQPDIFTAEGFYLSCASIPLSPEPFCSTSASLVLRCLQQLSCSEPHRTFTYAQLGRLTSAMRMPAGSDIHCGSVVSSGLPCSDVPALKCGGRERPVHARAVASALKANPILLLIPCHMVVPSGAGMSEPGGFVLGSELKRHLLSLWQADLD